MLLRQEKGLEIATKSRIERITGGWLVPSQTKRITYRVHDYGRGRTCTCPDAKFRNGVKCKHVWAVEYWVEERDGWKCTECGRPLKKCWDDKEGELTEVHHIIPRCEGGTDHPENLRTLCVKCHRKETNKLVKKFALERDKKKNDGTVQQHLFKSGE